MTKLFLDTNITIDFIGERHPHYIKAAYIVSLADRGEISLVISALTYSTTYYIVSKEEGHANTIAKLSKFKVLVQTSDLQDSIIEKGLISNFTDFEDALQYHSALQENCDIIITRNGKDFKKASLPIMTPIEYLTSLKQ
jgi:predicted nucleic acid-binding protein